MRESQPRRETYFSIHGCNKYFTYCSTLPLLGFVRTFFSVCARWSFEFISLVAYIPGSPQLSNSLPQVKRLPKMAQFRDQLHNFEMSSNATR